MKYIEMTQSVVGHLISNYYNRRNMDENMCIDVVAMCVYMIPALGF